MLSAALLLGCSIHAAEPQSANAFRKDIRPILNEYCSDCHGDGVKKGGVAFDEFKSDDELLRPDLWLHALKNMRAGLMPPKNKPQPSAEDRRKIERWIKHGAFGIDPQNPDPGRVTLRRLNRVEYRNTVRDLMGIDFRTDEEFPADDTGYGFDTIGDVLSTSSMLLEKYMQAAETIVAQAVPLERRVTPQRQIEPHLFQGKGARDGVYTELKASLYDPLEITAEVDVSRAGTYRVVLDSPVRRSYAFDAGRAEAEWFVDGKSELRKELKWVTGMKLERSTEVKWKAGKHSFRLTLKPLVGFDEVSHDSPEGKTSVGLGFLGVTLVGPLEPEFAVPPKGYERFFPRAEVPADKAGRAKYAGEILRGFATRAFRRPVDEATVQKLVALASDAEAMPGGNFEKGIASAMTAVLASPRFLFRMEDTLPEKNPATHPLLDEWALASRLSYFLWSTMPDETLFQLAQRGELRANLKSQIDRMIQDERSEAFVRNFAGQWLQTRDVESVSIDSRVVQARDSGRERKIREANEARERINQALGQALKSKDDVKAEALKKELADLREKTRSSGGINFGGSLRTAMRREAEMLFQHLLRTDGSVLRLIDHDATFLNKELADFYGIPEVTGSEMRLVTLPKGSSRGGVLTMGTVLAVTSNPTRTSPVKRGLFILDNVLGTPPPPAPPNVPSLEAAEKRADGNERPLREALAIHRENTLCSSCHNRMDPLGLALENFNAMGLWRDQELGEPLAPVAGKLITGEEFADVRELKRVLVTARRDDYYHCLSEKLLTYALGRGPEPCDVETLDSLVETLRRTDGRFSSLISGIIHSTPFQRRQRNTP